jgi:DNA-binding XRE family transcriptional regulator
VSRQACTTDGRNARSPYRARGAAPSRRAMLTQGELAEKSGVGITSIVRIERDQLETAPRILTLRKLARGLGVDPRDLLDD